MIVRCRELLAAACASAVAGCLGGVRERVDNGIRPDASDDVEKVSITDLEISNTSLDIIGSIDQFGYDAQNSGQVAATVPLQVREKWIVEVGSDSGGLGTTARKAVHQSPGTLTVLDRRGDISRQFSNPDKSLFHPVPTLVGDVAFLQLRGITPTAENTGLTAVDLEESVAHWWRLEDYTIDVPITVHRGTLFFSGVDGDGTQFMGADATTGELEWSTPYRESADPSGDREPQYAVAATGDRLFGVLEDPNEVICLDTADGTRLWSHEFGETDWRTIRPPVVTDELVLLFGPDHVLIAFDHAGRERWRADQTNDERAGMVTYNDEYIFLPTESGLTALDHDGEKHCSLDITFDEPLYPPTLTENALLVNDTTKCRCISLDDPEIRWEWAAEEVGREDMEFFGFNSAPKVHGNDVILSMRGHVIKLE